MSKGRERRRLAAGGDIERFLFWLFLATSVCMWGVILAFGVDQWMSLTAASMCSFATVSLGLEMRRRRRALARLDAAADEAPSRS